ncbi:hypothetical protein DB345_10625 [Spartobacteria bacterium LR76]|nr:hypothetical protein DB345_10625 [Spartobacteria bacterium LR76]
MNGPSVFLHRSIRRPAGLPGFTLVELLAAIAILGILAGLLLPVMSRARSAANDAKCIGNLQQIGAGIAIYTAENNGKLPARATTQDPVSWQTRVQPYMNLSGDGALRKGIACPAASPRPVLADRTDKRSTYGISVYLVGSSIDCNLSRVTGSPVLMVVDMPTANVDDRGPWNDGRTTAAQRKAMFRHMGGTRQHGVFTDGHVESMKPSESGIFGEDGARSAWLPAGISYRFPGYWISPSPPTPTDNIE